MTDTATSRGNPPRLRERVSRVPPDFVVAALLTGLAAFLYLSTITVASLWADEGLTAWVMERHLRPFLSHITFEAPHYALYYMVLRVIAEVAGTSETALRSLSVASGVATVPLVYVIGLRLAPGRFVAVAASLLLIANGFVLHFAVEARVYPLVMMLATAATWLLLVAVDRDRPLHWVAYAIVMTAAIWAHFYAFFLLPAHLVWAWSQADQVRRHGLLAMIGCVVGAVPIGLAITLWSPTREWLGGFPTLTELVSSFARLAATTRVGWLPPILPAVYLVGLAVAFAVWLRRDRSPTLGLILLWVVTPIVVGLAVSLVRPVFLTRSLIIVAPALALALAYAVRQLRPTALAGVALAIVLVFSTQHIAVRTLGHHDFRSAIATVAERAEPGDAFVHVPPYAHMWMTPRYYIRRSAVADEIEVLNRAEIREAQMRDAIRSVTDAGGRLWLLVEINLRQRDPQGAKQWLRQIANAGYETEAEWTFYRLRLVLLTPGAGVDSGAVSGPGSSAPS